MHVLGRSLLLLSALFLLAPAALAQDDRDVVYQERTEIDFDDVDVAGEMQRPSGALMQDRRRADFNPLIRLREDYDHEIRISVDEIK